MEIGWGNDRLSINLRIDNGRIKCSLKLCCYVLVRLGLYIWLLFLLFILCYHWCSNIQTAIISIINYWSPFITQFLLHQLFYHFDHRIEYYWADRVYIIELVVNILSIIIIIIILLWSSTMFIIEYYKESRPWFYKNKEFHHFFIISIICFVSDWVFTIDYRISALFTIGFVRLIM